MLLTIFIAAIALLAVAGIYCVIATRNLLRVLIALEIVSKSATLTMLLAGLLQGKLAEAEVFIVILIIVEVVVTAIGAVLCIAIHARTGSLDIREMIPAAEPKAAEPKAAKPKAAKTSKGKEKAKEADHA